MSIYNEHKEMKGFPERIYVSTQSHNNSYGFTSVSQAESDLDDAVVGLGPTEVGIYQLVRVAKFHKVPVEIPKPVVKEIIGDKQ